MNNHQNARLTPKGRALMVRRILAGETPLAAAAASGVSERTARRWLARYRSEGEAGLDDRSSRPRHSPRRTPQTVVDRVVALRRQRWTGRRIARTVGVSPATVSRLLRHAGLNRLRDLEPAPPFAATSTTLPANCSLSTSKNSAASSAPATALPATRPDALAPPAGSSSTSPSTTILASPSPRSCPMSAAARPWSSSTPPWPTIARSA